MNNIPVGYKQTEVGVIPEDWKIRSIGDLASVSAGGTPSRKIPEYWNGSIPWITTSQIDFGMIAEAAQFITEDGLYSSATKLLPAGTLLMALYGQGKTRGKVGVLGFEATTNQACAAISIHGNVSREFLLHFLISRYEAIRNSSNSGSQENLNGQIVKDISIALPPTKAEQEAIAEALSDTDALIESLAQLITKKRHIKQGAMQELLTGKKRLPGFSIEWSSISLGELFTFKNGLNKAKEFFGHGTPIVNYMDVFRDSKIYSSYLEGRVALNSQEMKNFDVQKGDVLFTRTSETPEEIGMASVVVDNPIQTVFSGFVLRGRPKNDVLVDQFKAYCFRSEFVRSQIISKASYTTRALTNGRILSAVMLPVPSHPEQTAIAAILSDMDAEITALETKLAKTRQLKQGMMRELLTGRIRLK